MACRDEGLHCRPSYNERPWAIFVPGIQHRKIWNFTHKRLSKKKTFPLISNNKSGLKENQGGCLIINHTNNFAKIINNWLTLNPFFTRITTRIKCPDSFFFLIYVLSFFTRIMMTCKNDLDSNFCANLV